MMEFYVFEFWFYEHEDNKRTYGYTCVLYPSNRSSSSMQIEWKVEGGMESSLDDKRNMRAAIIHFCTSVPRFVDSYTHNTNSQPLPPNYSFRHSLFHVAWTLTSNMIFNLSESQEQQYLLLFFAVFAIPCMSLKMIIKSQRIIRQVMEAIYWGWGCGKCVARS